MPGEEGKRMSDKITELDDLLNDFMNDKKSEPSDISFKKESASAVAVEEKAEMTVEQEEKSEEKKENADISSETTEKDDIDKIFEKDDDVSDEQQVTDQKTMVVTTPAKQSNKANNNDTYQGYKKPEKHKKSKKKKENVSVWNNSIFGGFVAAFIVIIVAFVVALGGIALGKEYMGIGKGENEITFNIPQGSTSSDIADLLEENEIISHKTFFKLIFKLKAPDTIYPGDITLQPAMGYSAIIDKLATMRESYETATISFPEGVTLLEVAELLEENEVCNADDFLFEFNKDQGYDFEKEITGNDNAFYAMEGYFFPDTYEFYKNDTGYNITKIVREHFEKKFTDKMLAQMKKQKLTMNQLMTLASMVQWEAGSVEDMPKVASVFLNRLNDPDTFPSFQSDATSKYIEKVIKKEADTTASLEHYTESYDTYNYKGLPAGPVCNPGLEAINAVLNPEKTKYYYFCNNLKTGESYFAETLEEHEKNLVKAGLK